MNKYLQKQQAIDLKQPPPKFSFLRTTTVTSVKEPILSIIKPLLSDRKLKMILPQYLKYINTTK